MKNKLKIVSINTFIILVCVVFMIILVIVGVIHSVEKKEFENKKEQAIKNPLKIYENGINSNLSDFIKACEWENKDIDRVVLGIDVDGKGLSKYYIDDMKVVEKIVDVLDNTSFYGISSGAWEQRNDEKWTVQLIQGKDMYSLEFEGYDMDYENVEISKVDTCYVDDDSAKHISFPSVRKDGGWYNVLYGEGVYDKLLVLYNENIGEITKEQLKEIKTKQSTELTDYFRYIHHKISSQTVVDEKGDSKSSVTYKFPIKDCECYMEVEKYNVHGSVLSNTAQYQCLDIRRIEIFNVSGASIDLLECKDNELDSFLN